MSVERRRRSSSATKRRRRSSSATKRRSVERVPDARSEQAKSVLDASATDREAVSMLSVPSGQRKTLSRLLQLINKHPEMVDSLKVLTEVYKHAKANDPVQIQEQLVQSFQLAGRQRQRVQQADPLAAARERGAAMRKQMLEAHGGAMSAEQAGRLLGLTRQAVEARRRRGELLAYVIEGPRYRYPRWQFGSDELVLAGLDRVLAALGEMSPWSKGAFMTTGDNRLNGATPVERLATGDIEAVVQAAAAYGEQDAA